MNYTNANSFKAKIKKIAKEKNIPAQQVQQIYLIEQILRRIANSDYKDNFIVKGGYLVSNVIGIDKRTTMDLDVTLKDTKLRKENLLNIFENVLHHDTEGGFQFQVISLASIRKDDDYGGFEVKINANFDMLREVVFIDITTGDKITPHEIHFSIKSVFDDDEINILSYNLETVLAEKLEAVISRGEGSTRPRDRFDLYTIWQFRQEEINLAVLKEAINNTVIKRKTQNAYSNWISQVELIRSSDYQRQLWEKYQQSFKYAREISFEASVDIIKVMMSSLQA